LNKDKKVKQSRFRQWKSGKKWLYSATALALLVGGGFALSQVSHVEFPQTHVSADVVMPHKLVQSTDNLLSRHSPMI
jgi:hypothetical protein